MTLTLRLQQQNYSSPAKTKKKKRLKKTKLTKSDASHKKKVMDKQFFFCFQANDLKATEKGFWKIERKKKNLPHNFWE